MGRRLLFFPILRTRSARKKLVGGSVIVLLGTVTMAGCDDDSPPQDLERAVERASELAAQTRADPAPGPASSAGSPYSPRDEMAQRLAKEIAALEVEAGIERGRDLPAPGGDLAHDVDTFTTLDACVRSHRLSDPVLADAIDTLGYDTLVRDACRTLQALKAKDGKFCAPIAASPLRQRCEAQVAILVGQPALCPLSTGSGAVQAREPVCLARASRDDRLCAGALPDDRATCQALVRGRSSECGSDEACVRQVERYRGLLEKPASRAPFPARLHVEFASEPGKGEKYDGAFDLDDLAAAGVVARPHGDKVRLTVGTPKNALWSSWDSPHASPLLFLTVSLPAQMPARAGKEPDGGPGMALGPQDLSFDLSIPHVASLTSSLASDRRATFEPVSAVASSPVHLALTVKVSDASRVFRVKIELESFVRDGVDPRSAVKSH